MPVRQLPGRRRRVADNVAIKKCHITFCVNPHEFYIAT